MEDLRVDRRADHVLHQLTGVGVLGKVAVQCVVAEVVLGDQTGRDVSDDVVVTRCAERVSVEQVVAAKEHMKHPGDRGAAVEVDPELLAHGARPAVTADQIIEPRIDAVPSASTRWALDAIGVLHEGVEPAPEPEVPRSASLRPRREERLERVLRDALVRLAGLVPSSHSAMSA